MAEEPPWDGITDRRLTPRFSDGDIKEIAKVVATAMDLKTRFWGFTLQELVRVGVIIVMFSVAFLKQQATQDELVANTGYLATFAENSDNYHSAVQGTRFKQGQPVDPSYETKSIRDKRFK